MRDRVLGILLIIVIAGVLLIYVSLALCVRRTGSWASVNRFWMRREHLAGPEYLLNRVGFWSSVIALSIALLLSIGP